MFDFCAFLSDRLSSQMFVIMCLLLGVCGILWGLYCVLHPHMNYWQAECRFRAAYDAPDQY
jgi:hypothetical protein